MSAVNNPPPFSFGLGSRAIVSSIVNNEKYRLEAAKLAANIPSEGFVVLKISVNDLPEHLQKTLDGFEPDETEQVCDMIRTQLFMQIAPESYQSQLERWMLVVGKRIRVQFST